MIQLLWDIAFMGRYPFTNALGKILLLLLGDYIRNGNGRISQFIEQQLAGVIQQTGN